MTGECKKTQVRAIVVSALGICDKLTDKLEEIDLNLARMQTPVGNSQSQPTPQYYQACRFQVMVETDGTGTVSVDDVLRFRVPPVLARLAQVLAMETGDASADGADDPYVPYKTTGFILSQMARLLGRRFTEGALKQAVCRLRKIMAGHGCARLLETHKFMKAYRVRLRRNKMCAVAAAL